MSTLVGQTVSHYRILDHLGAGGMGVVYKAQDLKLDRPVALKFLPPELTLDPEAKQRFVLEAKAASALQQNNICVVHDIDETADGQLFISTEYLEGETLKKKIQRGPSEIDAAIDIVSQIAQGLATAHGHRIVHRDIKPANIIITKDGVAKIVDFGLAKLAGEARLTQRGSTIGTVAYMSPEQARGEDVDHRSDIWSLGVVFYELVTGRLPFQSQYDQAVVYSILNDTPASPRSARPDLPERAERLILRCLEKDPDQRPHEAAEIVAALIPETATGTRPLFANVGSGSFKAILNTRQRSFLAAGILVLGLAAAGIIVFGPPSDASRAKSIAVLPFANLSGNPDDEYFSDGITEDILTQLSKIHDLRVISRTSVMQYKKTTMSIREIAADLNVGAILEGTVRRADNQIRIVAQLIDARTDKHLWAETYDREYTQVFAIQTDVATKIARALQAELLPLEQKRIERPPTGNIHAYESYLRGRDHYYRYTLEDNETAIRQFKQALALDSTFALALAGLGDAYAQRVGRFSYPLMWLDSAVHVSKKAIDADSGSAEGFKALAAAFFNKGWLRASLDVNHKAIDRNPNYVSAILNLGIAYAELGKFPEALQWQKRVLERDPAFAGSSYHLQASIYAQLDMPQKAEQSFARALDLIPDYTETHYLLALFHLTRNGDAKALRAIERLSAVVPDDARSIEQIGHVYGILGDFSRAEQMYRRAMRTAPNLLDDPFSFSSIGLAHILLKKGSQHESSRLLDRASRTLRAALDGGGEWYIYYYSMAAVFALRNEKAEAYQWLEEAIKAGFRDYRLTERDPWFESMRDDVRFKDMMKKLGDTMRQMREEVESTEADQ